MKYLLFYLCFLSLLFSCKMPSPAVVEIPYEVMPISSKPDTVISSNGMFYALPRQRLSIDIVVKKQEFIKGTYAEFAEKLLGVKSAIKNNSSVYSIDKVSISQKAEVDPKQIYFVQFNDSELALEYRNGLLLNSVNSSKRKSYEYGKEFSRQPVNELNPRSIRRTPFIYTDNFVERLDTIVTQQLVDTQIIHRHEIRMIKTEKTPLQKAEEIIEDIAKIRADRNKLLTGFQEVNYEANTIKYMADEYNRMEDEYLRLFIGTTKVSYETAHFEFLPEYEDSLNLDLAGFSTSVGLVPHASSNTPAITLSITLGNDEAANAIRNFSKNIQMSKSGFYYVIPNQSLIRILWENQIISSKSVLLSQFGLIQSLAPDLLQIEFSPQTGEVLGVKTQKQGD